MAPKLVMGYTKHGDKMHLVSSEDLAVGLCGVIIDHHVRRLLNGPLVLWADHWRDDAVSSYDRTCVHCLEYERRSRRSPGRGRGFVS